MPFLIWNVSLTQTASPLFSQGTLFGLGRCSERWWWFIYLFIYLFVHLHEVVWRRKQDYREAGTGVDARSREEAGGVVVFNMKFRTYSKHKYHWEMKEQLVQLQLQLAGVLWPRGKSKSSPICFHFWSCLSIGQLTSSSCSAFAYKIFFTFTSSFSPYSFSSLPAPILSVFLSFPDWFLGDLGDDVFYDIFAAHGILWRNQKRILLPLPVATFLYPSSNIC